MKIGDRVRSTGGMNGTVLKVVHERGRYDGNAMAKAETLKDANKSISVLFDNQWKSENWIGQAHLTIVEEVRA